MRKALTSSTTCASWSDTSPYIGRGNRYPYSATTPPVMFTTQTESQPQ